jgi:CDP-glucose 4,6-dehydratase
VTDLVRRILEAMGSGLEPVVLNEATHEIRNQFLSAAKARKTLDWTPLFDMDQGLQRTVAWYRAFFEDEH